MNKKIYAVFITALLLGVVTFYTGYTMGASPITDNVFMPGTQIEQADYVIFQDGSTTYVKDGITGNIPYYGTNDSLIFQTVLTLCANTSGRSVYVRTGSYDLDQGLIVDLRTDGSGGFSFVGEPGAVFTSNVELPVQVWSSFFEIYGGENILVKGISLNDGNSGTDYGIHFSGYYPTNVTWVTECSFYNFIDAGTHWLGEVLVQHRGHGFTATYNYFENCEQGIVISSTSSNMTNINLLNNMFVGCGHSINCEVSNGVQGASAVSIAQNTIIGSDVYTRGLGTYINAINVYAQADDTIYDNLAWSIVGNNIRFRPFENATGIRVTLCPQVTITGNTIANTHFNDSSPTLYAGCGAIQVRGSPGAVVSANNIYNGTVGINLFQTVYEPDYMSVTGNTVRDMTGAGYYIYRGMYNIFSGNIAQNCGTWGFQEEYVAYTVNNTYIGNNALDCTIGGLYVINHSSNHARVVACWNSTTWISETIYP